MNCKMLKIPENIFEDMAVQAAEEAPIEACGILAGSGGTVEKFYRMTNVDASSDHFMMQPKEQFAAVKDIRNNNMQMLAIAHSHPETPARPSEEDIRLALTPGAVYVILSLMDQSKPDIRGFLIDDGEIDEVEVKIIRGQHE